MNNPNVLREFYLDASSKFELTGTPESISFPRWMQIAHCDDRRTALILVAGESVCLPFSFFAEIDSRLFIRYSAALAEISPDGLTCEIHFQPAGQMRSEALFVLPIPGGAQPARWRDAEFDLSFLRGEGQLVLKCGAGGANDPKGDWLAIADLCVGRSDRLSVLKARSFHELRVRNEIEHFNATYLHSMYVEDKDQAALGDRRPEQTIRGLNKDFEREAALSQPEYSTLEPLPQEAPFVYASRVMDAHIPEKAPDFLERLRSAVERKGRLRVLSLCSGAARIEASYAEQLGPRVEWSLFDINAQLLTSAANQFSSDIKVDLIEGNVNELHATDEKWDVILCVSAFHHVVELERVIQFCHDSLAEGGEFWSIGEYVGRNGNRLWPEARIAANEIFRKLPERYRLNRHSRQIDAEVPDNDFSVGCFEAVRSEDIEALLSRWFHSEHVYRRNCFLWRLIDLSYNDNFDVALPEDREWIMSMVKAELKHFREGGRGTELFGVYRPRLVE